MRSAEFGKFVKSHYAFISALEIDIYRDSFEWSTWICYFVAENFFYDFLAVFRH